MPLLGRRTDSSRQAGTGPAGPLPAGKTDLLLRFFDSTFFDEWIALTYLYKSNSPGVQDYLCNRLYALPEAGLEKFLSQLIQLIIIKPYGPLERVVVDLCAKSLRIAVKTYWLLLAVSQDQPKNKYVAELRDCCERAALEGSWDPPFKRTRLLPLSPPRSRGWLLSSPISPGLLTGSHSGKLRAHPGEQRVTANSSNRFGSPDPFQGRDRPQQQHMQQPGGHHPGMDIMSRPTSPDGLGGGIYSSYTMGAGLEGLICASPPPTRNGRDGPPRAITSTQIAKATEAERAEARSLSADRRQKLKLELGESEGISALLENSLLGATEGLGAAAEGGQSGVVKAEDGRESPPSSPRLRQTTFGATLDFIEALCDASSRLTSFPPEDREWALKRGLDEINKEIEAASRADVACWFPMGTRDERIVRLAAKEAQLLNSREKAPFMLLVEVLSNGQGSVREDAKYSAGSASASPPPAALPRKATQTKTVPRPYTPEGREQRNSRAVLDDSESSPEALAGSSPKRILDFTGQSAQASAAPQQAQRSVQESEPLAVDIGSSRNASAEGLRCPVTSSFSHPEHQAAGGPSATNTNTAPAESVGAGRIPQPASAGSLSSTGMQQSSSSSVPERQLGGGSMAQPQGPAPAGSAQQPSQKHERAGALSAALGHRPQPVNIPAEGSSAEPSPDMLPAHAAVVGSPTTTAPIMASIRRTRSNEDGLQDGTHDLKTLGSGGMRLGPASLVRAVGRVIRSVVGGDSDDSHQHPAHQSSTEAADTAARVALAAAHAGMGPAQQAQEDARAARLRHTILDDMSGALGDSRRSGSFLPESSPLGAPESSENSFSRGLQSAMAGLGGRGPPVTVRLEVIGDYTREELEAMEAVSQLSSEPCQHRPCPGEGSSLPSRGSQGGAAKKLESKDSVVSGARALTLLCHWGNCKTKEDDIRHTRMQPHVKVRLKVHGGVDLRLANKPMSVHRRIPSDEALMRMAAYHRAPVPKLPTLTSPPTSPSPSQDLTSIVEAMHEAVRKATEADAQQPPQQDSVSGAQVHRAAAAAEAGDGTSQPLLTTSALASRTGEEDAGKAAAAARAVYGEPFADKAKRVQGLSPHGRRPGWAVRPIIVKSGDDCRQELLAAQLIQAFAHIFQESSLPLYVRPYEVLVTSSRTALIEVVPDSLSIHTIKAKGPVNASLSDHFFAKFGRGSVECKAAQRAFAESMAAYSLVCYFLQIKDRHNGNILMDVAGHIIHIDFGFMLSNSPGGVNFEAAPFKLTRELLEIMDSNSEGHASEIFDYFKVLCIQGFLACRKHADRIILLVDMMSTSGCPCFKAGPRCVAALRKRFHLHCTETQCVEVVLNLIADSLDAWRTRQYDYYQRVLNGIL